MNSSLLIIIAFIVALAIGFFIGKMLSKAEAQSQKSGLEERVNGLLAQIEQLKIQFQSEKNNLEKIISQLNLEKENVQKEKEDFAIHLEKKENDFDNLSTLKFRSVLVIVVASSKASFTKAVLTCANCFSPTNVLNC